jgi:hypothetical protein
MNKHFAVPLLVLAAVFCNGVGATPLEEVHGVPVSRLEYGSLKLEVGLTGIKDWPFPIEGASVAYQVNPDKIDIVVALKIDRNVSFRTACARTIARVREFLYVDAEGNAPMGRSYLGSYFRGPWRGDLREAALRAMDASTLIRVDIVKRGSCKAALIKAPITFESASPN